MTITLVVLAVVVGWLVVSAVTAYLLSAVVGGGAAEDEIRGYVDGAVAEARQGADDSQLPSPRRTEDGMGES
jgi:hypothetical protein